MDEQHDDDGRPSRSAVKREAEALQGLGADLVKLKPGLLGRFELPDRLRDAITQLNGNPTGGTIAFASTVTGTIDLAADLPNLTQAAYLKGCRYTLWKNPEDLTDRQAGKLAWIARHNQTLYRAYMLNGSFGSCSPTVDDKPFVSSMTGSPGHAAPRSPPSSSSTTASSVTAKDSSRRSPTACRTG